MKTNKITRKEIVNDCMVTLTFSADLRGFNTDQVGGTILNEGADWVNTTETDLQVGDAITDGSEPVIAQVHGQSEKTTVDSTPLGGDYRDVFANKHGQRNL